MSSAETLFEHCLTLKKQTMFSYSSLFSHSTTEKYKCLSTNMLNSALKKEVWFLTIHQSCFDSLYLSAHLTKHRNVNA